VYIIFIYFKFAVNAKSVTALITTPKQTRITLVLPTTFFKWDGYLD